MKLASPATIDRVVVHGHSRANLVLRAAALQVRQAGPWQTIAGIEDNDKGALEFTFPPCRAKELRLWITDACRQDSTARIFEVELFAGAEKIAVRVPYPGLTAWPQISDEALLDSVRPLPGSLFQTAGDDRIQALLGAYRRSMAGWGEVLSRRIEPVPDRPGEAYYGRGGNREDDIRPIGYAVMVNGLLSRMNEPGPDRARDDAVAALRYLTASHVTGPSTCLNGRKWGNAWQSAMWARAAGVGAWALWGELDRDLKLAAARMVEHEADRFIDQAPKSSVNRDTGAEENAWNALILSIATNMMPGHPRASDWQQAAKRYMYNVFSVPADASDDSPGDDGTAIKKWVTTVNAHADFTVENHGLVHIGYQKTSIAQLLENAIHYLAVGREPPAACLHHVAEATELLYRCSAWDGAPVYFGGNDWKIVHTQPTDLTIYSVLSVLAGDRRAALQEERGLGQTERLQQSESGYFNVRRDLEYGGLCATRLAACYLAHAARGAGAEPVTPAEFDRQTSGVLHLEGGRAMLHRTGDKFASFAFGPKWMALTVPSGPDRTIWPHFASYLGLIDGESPTEKQAESIRLSPPPFNDGFWAVGRLKRAKGSVQHDFAFVSPAAGVTVYVERLRPIAGDCHPSRETGIVGHEYDIGSNRRILHGRFGAMTVEGTGGEKTTHVLATDWLNVGGRIGYAVKRFPKADNVVRYHDLTGGSGRVPKLQEWFSLVGDADEQAPWTADRWACIVTYPNRSAEETRRLVEQVLLETEAESAIVEFPAGIGSESRRLEVGFADGEVCMD